MRKKPIPAPIETARQRGMSRPLAPAAMSSRLPTAAALAVALACLGAGCSIPMEDGLRPDPIIPFKNKTAPAAPAPAPSPSPAIQNIEPDPHQLDGDVAVVIPKPVTKPPVAVKPFVPGPLPSGIHKTAGKPAMVHPGSGSF